MCGQRGDEQARRIEELEGEVTTKSTVIQNLQGQVRQLVANNTRLQSEHYQLKSSVDELSKECGTLKETCRQYEVNRKELEKIHRDFDGAKVKLINEIAEARASMGEAEKMQASLEWRLLEAKNKETENEERLSESIENEKKRSKQLEESLNLNSTLEEKNATLSRCLSEVKASAAEELNEKLNTISSLQEDNDSLRLEIERISEESDKKVKTLEEQYEMKRARYQTHFDMIGSGYSEKFTTIIQALHSSYSTRISELIQSHSEERHVLAAAHSRENETVRILFSGKEDQLIKDRSETAAKLESLEIEFSELQEEILLLRTQREGLMNEKHQLEVELHTAKATADLISADLRHERDNSRRAADESQLEREKLNGELRVAEEKISNLNDRIKMLVEDRDRDEGEIHKEEAKYIEGLLKEASADKDDLKKQIKSWEDKFRSLQSSLESERDEWIDKEVSILEDNNAKQKSIENLEDNRKRLQEALSQKVTELSLKENRIKELEVALDLIKQGCGTANSELSSAMSAKLELQEEITRLTALLDDAKKTSSKREGELQKLEAQTSSEAVRLKKQIEDLSRAKTASDDRVREMEEAKTVQQLKEYILRQEVALRSQLDKSVQELKAKEAENVRVISQLNSTIYR
ncbi:hypothetical protein HDU67_009560 [Dinochytrium kinnereticum]|nr:hypothetical protein HDU67_009560 [Dinochytrium kinnereticum]